MKISMLISGLLLSLGIFAAELQHPSKQSWDAKLFHKSTKASLPLAQEVLDVYPLRNYRAILDIGCGSGALTAYMAKKTKKTSCVSGFDPSESMIKFAQGYYQKPANLYFRQSELPLVTEHWDFIFCCNMFHLLTREKQVSTLNRLALCARKNVTVPLLLIMAAKNDTQAITKAYAATISMPRWENVRLIKLHDYFQPHDAQSFAAIAKDTPWTVTKTEMQDEYIKFKTVKELKRFITSWIGGFEFVAQMPKQEQKEFVTDLVENYKKEVPQASDESIEWRSPKLIVHAEKQV